MKARTRFVAALAATVLSILFLPFAVPVSSQIEEVSASASGTVVHAHLLQSGDTRLVDTEVAFSGAAYDSDGLRQPLLNEVGRQFSPQLADKAAYGRGSALEVGQGVTPDTDNQVILAGKAEASSPPRTGPVSKEAGPVEGDPIAWANLLRGQAVANAASNECLLGMDASRGQAYASDVQLLDAASDASTRTGSNAGGGVSAPLNPSVRVPAARAAAAPAAAADDEGLDQPVVALDASNPSRAVSNSRSRTLFVAQRGRDGKLLGSAFGIMSEVRETIAPVTLFKGTENEFTIEFLGEWVLQAVATGLPGGAYYHYGPGAVSPETPVLRLIDAEGTTNVVTFQQLVGDQGLVIEIPGAAEIAIGEPPRAIGGAARSAPGVAADGTSASAAADVVRVRALAGADFQLSDLRIGHMEVRTQVPSGGVGCPIPVKKTPSVDSVDVGNDFNVTFMITNPYDCTLTGVKLVDDITTEDDARFTVAATVPAAGNVTPGDALDAGSITWSNVSDIAPGKSVTLEATIGARSGAGAIVDEATATATLKDCAEEGSSVAGVAVGVVGSGATGAASLSGTSNTVRVPVVETVVAAEFSQQEGELPATGAPVLALFAVALNLIAFGGAVMRSARKWAGGEAAR